MDPQQCADLRDTTDRLWRIFLTVTSQVHAMQCELERIAPWYTPENHLRTVKCTTALKRLKREEAAAAKNYIRAERVRAARMGWNPKDVG